MSKPTSSIVFQLTEKELRQMVWDFKNYGKSADEEQPVTAKEMKAARKWAAQRRKRFAESFMDYLDQHMGAQS